MMLVTGEFDIEEMLSAASDMARGVFSVANAPTQKHPEGFGLVWADPNAQNGFRIIKDEASLWSYSPQQIIARAGSSLATTKTLAIHARFALLPHQKGLRFTQPVTAEADQGTTYFMHNGYTPQMYLHLGMSESAFDSEEYSHVVKKLMATNGFESDLRKLLEGMGEDTTSANFLMLGQQEILAFNWWPNGYYYSEYAQMHRLEGERYIVISSEMINTLSPKNTWNPLSRGQLIKLKSGH